MSVSPFTHSSLPPYHTCNPVSQYPDPAVAAVSQSVVTMLLNQMYLMTILLYLMSILLYLTGQATATQTFQEEPSDVTVNLGDNVTLPCKVSNRKGDVQWTRDDFGLGIDRQLSGFSRYKMLGKGGGDDFSLEIAAVSLEDDARFQCQVGAAGGGVGAIQSAMLLSPCN